MFHYRNLNLNVQTVLDRDTISLAVIVSHQSSTGAAVESAVSTKSVTVQWQRDSAARPEINHLCQLH